MGIRDIVKGKYKGCEGLQVSEEKAPLYDDLPSESVEEMVLKVLAGGQVAEDRRRRAYYDVDSELVEPEDIDEVECDGDELDYIQAYNELRERKVRQWRERHDLPVEPVQSPTDSGVVNNSQTNQPDENVVSKESVKDS